MTSQTSSELSTECDPCRSRNKVRQENHIDLSVDKIADNKRTPDGDVGRGPYVNFSAQRSRAKKQNHTMAQSSRAASGAGGSAAAARSKASRRGLRGARRRLSVVSDNKLVEGVAHLGDVGDREVRSKRTEHVINMYAGVCKKGYAPYNPRKKNQDAILMDEHADTGSIFFAVFDGHGEAGDLVSHFFTDRLASRVFANSRFRTDPNRAVADETARLERALLAGVYERTSPSGGLVARALLSERQPLVPGISALAVASYRP